LTLGESGAEDAGLVSENEDATMATTTQWLFGMSCYMTPPNVQPGGRYETRMYLVGLKKRRVKRFSGCDTTSGTSIQLNQCGQHPRCCDQHRASYP
jgi:hypothetical protein